MAKDSDGRFIEGVLMECRMTPGGMDWSEVWPCWLVAELNYEIIGCVQTLPGKPFGVISFLAVIPKYQGTGVGALLWMAAEKLLAQSGSDGYSTISDDPKILKRFPKIGGIIFGEPVSWLIKRLYRSPKGMNDESLQKISH